MWVGTFSYAWKREVWDEDPSYDVTVTERRATFTLRPDGTTEVAGSYAEINRGQ